MKGKRCRLNKPWTISDTVKYKGSEINKDQRAALYFTMSDIVHITRYSGNLWYDTVEKRS